MSESGRCNRELSKGFGGVRGTCKSKTLGNHPALWLGSLASRPGLTETANMGTEEKQVFREG